MAKFFYSNRLFIGVLTGVILIVIGGTYYLKHLDNERTLEKERNMRLDYQQWHLPEGAKARIGTGTIRAMQYSPDGNLLAVVSDIGVWILDAQTAEPRHLLAAHTGIINSISFSPDGSTLAVGTENGTVQLWDTSTGEHQKTFTRRDYHFGVDNVFFMPDGRTLAVVSPHSIMDLWDIATGQRKNTLLAASENDPDANVRYIPDMYMSLGGRRNSFSSDGKTVASYIDDGKFRFWDVATRKEIRTLEAEPSGQLVSFSSDLQTVAIASYSYKGQRQSRVWGVNLWDVNTQMQKKIIQTDNFELPFLVFNPDGNFIASYVDKAIRIWDVYTGKEKKRFKGHKSTVTTVAFSPDNRTLVSSSYDNTLRFWDVDTGKEKKTVAGYGALFRDVSLSADAQTLMSLGPGSNTIRLWNSNTGQHEKNFIGHKKYVSDAALSPDGRRLASSSVLKNSIHLWDVNTGKHSKLKGPRRHVSGVAFSRDGETLASWGSSGKRKDVIQFYDADTGDIQQTLQLTDQDDFSGSEDLYFDKKMFAGFGKFDPNLFVWDLVAKDYNITSMKFTNEGYVKKVIVARFSPDGRVLAIVFKVLSLQALKTERNIVLRDVETGDHIRTLIGHTDDVESLAFSPDSRTLASGSGMRDKTIRLWDIETGSSKVVTDPSWADNARMYAGVASKIAFSPDGQTFASGMKRGDIHLWETATGAKKKTLRGHSQRIAHIFFSADGQTLISASDDGTMLIWNLTHPL
jgi:WD40 repeat protein